MASAGPATISAKGQLTTLIVSPSDLKRARREVESIDDAMHQAGLRATAGGTAAKLPATSRLIDELVSESGIHLDKAAERAQLLKYLSNLVEHAPVLHFSFASEPSAAFMNKLIIWLRTNIHPQTLVHLGLQPSVVAGCVVRTANRQFDFSLNSAFEAQHDILIQSLSEVTAAPKPATKPDPIETAVPTTPAVQAAAQTAAASAAPAATDSKPKAAA